MKQVLRIRIFDRIRHSMFFVIIIKFPRQTSRISILFNTIIYITFKLCICATIDRQILLRLRGGYRLKQ